MKKIISFLTILALTLSAMAQKPKVAVYVTGDEDINIIVGNRIVDGLAHNGKYITVERTANFLKALSAEHGYQRSGEVDDSQIAELGKQFGYERPLFGDESFYYPRNDCEDRAILYSILVRDLIGLDVVLVHYPGHLGTAVHFTENVAGSYYDVGGKHYVVCDPTYIGAGVGEVMPQFENTKVTIVRVE